MKFINFKSFLYEKACQFCHFEWRPVPTQNYLLIHLWSDWKAQLYIKIHHAKVPVIVDHLAFPSPGNTPKI